MITIADIHRKTTEYKKILDKYPNQKTIQLGDYGFQKEHDWHLANIDCDKHKLLFGNHDYYPYLHKKHSLGDYSIINENDNTFFCIRGANSIDKHIRNIGIDYFDNEEISYFKWYEILDEYEKVKPNIVITHDAPASIVEQLFGYTDNNLTRGWLQTLLEIHQPEKWIFGHHHRSRQITVNKTDFICLAELEYILL